MKGGNLTTFEVALSNDVSKAYWKGTHRAIDPIRTVQIAERAAPAMGITRIANVTGLDTLGVPTVMVVRPNSRSLAVSQGKGLTLEAAKASGLMESIELFHAEHDELSLRYSSLRDLRDSCHVADVDALPKPSSSRFHDRVPLLWCEGYDLIARQALWVPYEMVHTNFTLPMPAGAGNFTATSNGLASGNNMIEALSHAICEVVERDADALADLGPFPARKVDVSTVSDNDCKTVIRKCHDAGVEIFAFDITSDIGIPAFRCHLSDRSRPTIVLHRRSAGMGCHLDKNVAFLRAITEAAQSRLTVIAGSRDDLGRRSYQRGIDPWVRDHENPTNRGIDFGDLATFASQNLRDDVQIQLSLLQKSGMASVIAVDLSKPEYPFAVVRVIIPGLEPIHTVAGYCAGSRARRER